MGKIKTQIFRKYRHYNWGQYLVYWLKNVICVITFLTSNPKIWYFLHYETYDVAHNITNMSDIPAIFIFWIEFDVVNEMQMLFAAKILLCYLPRDQILKIYVQEIK